MAGSNDEVEYWFTTNGNHIPVKKGQSKEQALSEFLKSKGDVQGYNAGELSQKIRTVKTKPPIIEIDSETGKSVAESKDLRLPSPKEFHDVLSKAKENTLPVDRWRVDLHGEKDYANDKLYVSKGGSCVAVEPDGNIISVCHNVDDTVRGRDLLLQLRTAAIGWTLLVTSYLGFIQKMVLSLSVGRLLTQNLPLMAGSLNMAKNLLFFINIQAKRPI